MHSSRFNTRFTRSRSVGTSITFSGQMMLDVLGIENRFSIPYLVTHERLVGIELSSDLTQS